MMLDNPKTLAKNQIVIRTSEPAKQEISYYTKNWERHLPQCQELHFICHTFPRRITRGDLIQLAAGAKESGQLEDMKRLFVGTMVWGYGTTGYGPWRTAKMVASTSYPLVLMKTFNLIVEGRLRQAYNMFSLDKCGPSYFTKFFYFAGRGAGLKTYPLILDNQVYEVLKSIDVDVSQIAQSSSWTSDGYLNYVVAMHKWAEMINCEADQIELFLFQMADTTQSH